jgi:phosphoribosyl 1,2-cyclic phosphodiesterase
MKFCPLYSGSSGNSMFVSSENAKILVDAGLPGKHIDLALESIGEKTDAIDAIFVTHEHSDHIKGVGVLSRKYNIPIFANKLTWEAMKNKIGKIKEENIKIIEDDYTDIKDLHIVHYNISHDAACPVGYSICKDNKKVCIATDLGYFSKEAEKITKDADVILLESNHDIEMLKFGPYPYPLKRRILSDVGHLSNEACGKAILSIMNEKHKTIVLGHLSKTNNYPDLAYKTVENILIENGVNVGKDVDLSMAKRDMPSKLIKV